jgi:protein gp37
MGDKTAIQWTDATWNPIRGCRRVSAGCENCYAEKVANRFSGEGKPYEGLVTLKGRWNGKVMKVPHMLDQPLRWTKPRLVFVNSMSDLFFEALDFEYIAACFAIMAASPEHTFQVLTKRPEQAQKFFAWLGHAPWLRAFEALERIAPEAHKRALKVCRTIAHEGEWPLPNVWLGISAEDQETAVKRVRTLRRLPAAVHWISQEPQIGPINYRPEVFEWQPVGQDEDGVAVILQPIRWIVIGGESGAGARPFDIEWARQTLRETDKTECSVFIKQLGAVAIDSNVGGNTAMRLAGWKPNTEPVELAHRKGGEIEEWPEDLQRRDWPRVA